MPATFPLSLPQAPLANSFETMDRAALIRSAVDVGEDIVRPRFTRNIEDMTMVFNLTPAQATTLKSFYRGTLAKGALTFNWKHPITQEALICRFKSPPRFAVDGRFVKASCEMETL